MAEETGNLLKNIAVEKVHMKKVSAKSQFVKNLFLVMKEDGCNWTVKNLNQYIPHHYFKTESLNSLRDILKQGNFICKLDLKDAYFCIPLAEESKKFARLYWEYNGQQSGFDVFEKNGGNQESENGYTVKRNLRHINFKTDHDYCGVPTQLINTVADLESRRKVDSSKWILGGHVFRNLCLKLGTSTVPQHLFVSRISHQVAQ